MNRANRRYYSLKKSAWGGQKAILCDTAVSGTAKVVTIRSVLAVVNHLKVPVEVYYLSDSGNSVTLAGIAESGKPFNVPIHCLYTKASELYFGPVGYHLASVPCIWTRLLRDKEGFNLKLLCRRKGPDATEFHMKVISHNF